MNAYWVVYMNGREGCVEAESDLMAKSLAEDPSVSLNGPTLTVQILPYPAEPILHRASSIPSFCFQPSLCAGRSSCPRGRACTE